MTQPISPSQTIGPFSQEAWHWAGAITAAAPRASDAVTIRGVVRDGAGVPVNDAQLEAWAPTAAAQESAHPLPGFRRIPTDDNGAFHFVLPRPAAGEPVAYITLFARGLVLHQFTAVFLDEAIDVSPLLRQVPRERRATLVARPAGPSAYEWDIAMQGERETVFFDYAGPP
jgi:protocatechuate 3,4-dioxygenase alpha subunit